MRFSETTLTATAGFLVISVMTGCASLHLTEKQVISQFADALEEDNEPALRDVTSDRFQSRTMRSDDPLRDLSLIRLPTGDLEIISVEEISKTQRKVVVSREGSRNRIQLALKQDADSGRWVVDDVLMRARHSGIQVSMSVTDQMDLILSVREYLNALPHASRDEILERSSPGLQESMNALPATWMARLTSSISAEYKPSIARSPEAQMNNDDAVVKLPSRNGHLLVKAVKSDAGWLVDDIEVRLRRAERNHPGSLRRQAGAIGVASRFLTAYHAARTDELRATSTERFFRQTLQMAGSASVPLPTADHAPEDFDLQAFHGHASLSLPDDQALVRIDLKALAPEDPDTDFESLQRGDNYRVEEVTIYDDDSGIAKRLSAMVAAPARATLFVRSIQKRDLETVRQLSTSELRESVWGRLQPEHLTLMPLDAFTGAGLTVTDVRSPGSQTSVRMQIGPHKVLCVMREEEGSLRVDDVRLLEDETQTSLKTRLALMVPVIRFAQSWSDGDQRNLMDVCSADFNRLTWDKLATVPQETFADLPGA